MFVVLFFFSSRRRHTRFDCDWSSDVCSSDLIHLLDLKRDKYVGIGPAQMNTLAVNIKGWPGADALPAAIKGAHPTSSHSARSEERRVGKECRARWSPYYTYKKYTMVRQY